VLNTVFIKDKKEETMSEWRIQVLKKDDWVNGLVPWAKDDVYKMVEFYRKNGDTVRLLKYHDGDFEPWVIVHPIKEKNKRLKSSDCDSIER
jgi:hypothetical protein